MDTTTLSLNDKYQLSEYLKSYKSCIGCFNSWRMNCIACDQKEDCKQLINLHHKVLNSNISELPIYLVHNNVYIRALAKVVFDKYVIIK